MTIAKWARCAAMSFALLFTAGAATADEVQWTITPTIFGDGGQISGSFIYDADTNIYSSINIVTSAGAALAGATYVRIDPANGFTPSATQLSPRTTGMGAGQPIVRMLFSAPLTNAGGLATSTASEGTCVDACVIFADIRIANGIPISGVPTPAVAPVPTMSEWAMILFGTILAGAAALYIQRRRQFS